MSKVSISKPKLSSLLILSLFIIVPSMTVVHGLYVVNLPSNTLFADDFNEYVSGTDLRNGYGTGVNGCPATGGTNNQCVGKSGWGWYDNGLNGYSHASNNQSYSAPIGMEMASSSTLTNGKFDIHHMVPVSNTTTVVSLSAYFAFDNFTRNGSGGNNQMTFSIEAFDYNFKYECVLFVAPGAATVQISSADSLPNSGFINLRIAAIDDTRMVYGTGEWHHVQISCDVRNHRYVSVLIDNWNVLAQLGVTSAATDQLADSEMIVASKPFTIPVRVEFAQLTFITSGYHVWHKWMDDVVVTDVTSPQPVIQFGISLFSGWFVVLMASIGVLYGTSGIGLARRIILGKTEGMLQSYKVIVMTGLIATIGFIIILVVGALLTQQVCNSQHVATCSY